MKFIPKRAPWFGGFWERLIGLTKLSLKKILGRTFVTLPVLQTLIIEVEAMLNNRPLTYLSSDVTDPQPLTPSHLIYGQRIVMLPDLMCEDDEVTVVNYQIGLSGSMESQGTGNLVEAFLDKMEERIINFSERVSLCDREQQATDHHWRCSPHP